MPDSDKEAWEDLFDRVEGQGACDECVMDRERALEFHMRKSVTRLETYA